MESLSFSRRLIKIAALGLVSLGLGLHIYLTYNSVLLAGLVLTAIGVVNILCISVLWPRPAAHMRPSEVRIETELRAKARSR